MDGIKMTIPLPPYVAPYKPVPQVTPFTYRDGITMLKKLELLQRYINKSLVPWVNENMAELADAFETQANALIEAVNAALEMQTGEVDQKIADLETYVNEQVALIIGDSIQVQDPVVAGIMTDAESESRTVTDALYASTELVNEGRLSNEALTEKIAVDVNSMYAIVNAKDYGVDESNETNDDEFAAAFAALPETGGILRLDNGSYTVATTLDFRGKDFTLDGNGSTITCTSNVAGGAAIRLGGSIATNVAVGVGDVVKGDKVLSVSNTTPFTENTLVRLRSTDVFDDARPTVYFKGELFTVGSVGELELNLKPNTVFRDAYTDTSVTLDVVTPNSVRVNDLFVKTAASNGTYGVVVENFINSHLSNVEVHGFKRQGFQIRTGVMLEVINCAAYDSNEVALGYGIMMMSAENITVKDFDGFRNRHTVDIGGSNTDTPCRSIIYDGIRAHYDLSAGISTHGHYEGLVIINCHSYWCGGGIAVRGAFTSVSDCLVVGYTLTSEAYAPGITVGDGNYLGRAATGLSISNVTIDMTGTASKNINIVTINAPIKNASLNNLTIVGNIGTAIFTRNMASIENFTIENCKFSAIRAAGADADYTILMDNAGGTTKHKKISIKNNVFSVTGAKYISNARIAGGAASYETESVVITNNVFDGYGTACVQLNNGNFGRLVNIINNTMAVSGATPTSLGISVPASFLLAPTTYPNVYENHGFGRNGHALAAPTTGTHLVGEVVWNYAPAATGYIGWVCTAGGTPGTWKGFGAIQA